MINFEWTAAKFFYFFFFMFFTLVIFTFYGMMSVAITPNLQFATIISTSFFSFWNLFSGFMIPRLVNKFKQIEYSNFMKSCILHAENKTSQMLLQKLLYDIPHFKQDDCCCRNFCIIYQKVKLVEYFCSSITHRKLNNLNLVFL